MGQNRWSQGYFGSSQVIVHLLAFFEPHFPCRIIRLLPAIYTSVSYTEIGGEFALKLDDQR